MERFGEPIENIKAVFEVSISRNFTHDVSKYTDLWLSYIDCYRRQMVFSEDDKDQTKQDELRTIFTTGNSFLASYKADPECKLLRYWAVVEADTFKSMSEARKIWSEVVSHLGDRAKPWLEYAQLEANLGSIKHQRKVYQRAIER